MKHGGIRCPKCKTSNNDYLERCTKCDTKLIPHVVDVDEKVVGIANFGGDNGGMVVLECEDGVMWYIKYKKSKDYKDKAE